MNALTAKLFGAAAITMLLLRTTTCAQDLSKAKPSDFGIKSKKALDEYRAGMEQMRFRDYATALTRFRAALAEEPDFVHAHFHAGACVYLSNLSRTATGGTFFKGSLQEAVPHLEKALAAKPEEFVAGRFYLAQAYLQAEKYTQAAQEFEKFLSSKPKNKSEAETAEKNLRFCRFAAEAVKKPRQFRPVNLGENVNGPGVDVYPSLTADGAKLFFTSRREGNVGGYDRIAGDFTDDIYYCVKQSDGSWSAAQNMGEGLNTKMSEGAARFSQDGKQVFFVMCEAPGGHGSCDVYAAEIFGESWAKPVNLGKNVNSPYWESCPSPSYDGKTLYFVSNRDGGLGGYDIWESKWENGAWSPARNLGPPVNTPGDELYPFLHADDQTFYFSSDYHTGFGGLDFFRCVRRTDGTFSAPENLGYPINGPEDEHGLFVDVSGTKAYFFGRRKDTKGKEDVYEFDLDAAVRPRRTPYVKGTVKDAVTGNAVTAAVAVQDLATGDTVRNIRSHGGEFVLSLPTGKKYAAFVEAEGYLFSGTPFFLDEAESPPFYEVEIKLSPVKKGAALTLRNVFFQTGSATLSAESAPELDKVVRLMSANPKVKIELGGHTDNVGGADFNLKLSTARAEAVKTYLMQKGVAAERIVARGYGETSPVAPNDTPEGRAANRRTELKILETDR